MNQADFTKELDIQEGDKIYYIRDRRTKGCRNVHRICAGFTPFELLGVLEHAQHQIIAQIDTGDSPEIIKVKKQVFVDED